MCNFPHGKVFGPPCIFPRGYRRWGPIFSNYRAPLVIITTNQLVANFVKVHQYFTRTSKFVIIVVIRSFGSLPIHAKWQKACFCFQLWCKIILNPTAVVVSLSEVPFKFCHKILYRLSNLNSNFLQSKYCQTKYSHCQARWLSSFKILDFTFLHLEMPADNRGSDYETKNM